MLSSLLIWWKTFQKIAKQYKVVSFWWSIKDWKRYKMLSSGLIWSTTAIRYCKKVRNVILLVFWLKIAKSTKCYPLLDVIKDCKKYEMLSSWWYHQRLKKYEMLCSCGSDQRLQKVRNVVISVDLISSEGCISLPHSGADISLGKYMHIISSANNQTFNLLGSFLQNFQPQTTLGFCVWKIWLWIYPHAFRSNS